MPRDEEEAGQDRVGWARNGQRTRRGEKGGGGGQLGLGVSA
jgi:hypothetical protein